MDVVLMAGRSIQWLRVCCIFLLVKTLLGSIKAPVYKENDFISNVPDSPHFVMFFAPWCSHCERLSPLWDMLASHFEMKGSSITAAKVDCTKDTHLCAQEHIKAYPTLRFFNNGQKETYRGSRGVPEFIEFSNKQASKSEAVPDPTDDLIMELDKYKFEKEIQEGLKIVNFFAPWCAHCKRLAPIWKQLGKVYQYSLDVRILEMNCEKEKMLCRKYEVSGFPSIIAFANGVWKGKHEGGRSIENLKEFVDKMIAEYNADIEVKPKTKHVDEIVDAYQETTDENLPGDFSHDVINIGKDIFDLTVQNGKTFVYFFAPWCTYCQQFAPVWNELATTVYNEGIMVKIAKVDCTKEMILCRELKISQYPSLLFFKTRLSFELYKGNRDLKSLVQFLKQHEHDEL